MSHAINSLQICKFASKREPVAGEGWLTVHSVWKSYKGRPVVRGASLSVGRGESVGLLGQTALAKPPFFT